MAQRVPTDAELLSCTSDGKRTVAESADTGEPVHIEDAEKGLACRCVCPGCGRPMVAHKGSRRRHFQHAAEADGRTCTSSGETALHKFAKKTLASTLRLRLPELSESDGRSSVEVVQEGDFEFDQAALEKRDGEVVPDVVCLKGKRCLHVEFMVTHRCGPEKIERIRRMEVGAVEIDLSGYRDCPLDELASAILSEGPRKWLHNPKSSAARLCCEMFAGVYFTSDTRTVRVLYSLAERLKVRRIKAHRVPEQFPSPVSVDILRYQQEIASESGFKPRQRLVRGVRPDVGQPAPAHVVELVHPARMPSLNLKSPRMLAFSCRRFEAVELAHTSCLCSSVVRMPDTIRLDAERHLGSGPINLV